MGQSDLSHDIAKISTNNIRGYAKTRGWVRLSGDVGSLAVFRHLNRDLDQLLVPLDPQRSDYVDRIADAVAKLVEIEQRPQEAIIFDIMNFDADVIRYRVASPATEKGTIPLEDAIDLLEGARRSLLAAAHSVITPQKFHPRLGRGEADALLKSCRMGQTERGSFTVTLSCPLRALEHEAKFGNEPAGSFARQTTRFLAASIRRIYTSIQRDSAFTALEETAEQPVISANLCDALLRMRPEDNDAALIFNISWAPSEPVAEPAMSLNNQLTLQGEDFEEIENLYDQLKPQQQPKNEVFVGLVDQLKGILTSDNQRRGEVVLSLFDPTTEEVLKTRADLNVDQYRLADQLHMLGKMIVVHGRIQRGRRISRLQEIQLFEEMKRD